MTVMVMGMHIHATEGRCPYGLKNMHPIAGMVLVMLMAMATGGLIISGWEAAMVLGGQVVVKK